MHRTADCVGGMIEHFDSSNQSLRGDLPNKYRGTFEGSEVLVHRCTLKIDGDGFVERQLRFHISLIGQDVVFAVSGIGQAGDVVVVVGITLGDGQNIHDFGWWSLPGNELGWRYYFCLCWMSYFGSYFRRRRS